MTLPAGETVYLDFWRWLNTDPPAQMVSKIEAWNGSMWMPVFTSSSALQTNAWSNFTYDVSAYKNAHFKVRFGFSMVNGAPLCSSWNIDHVRLIRHIDQGC